MGEAVVLSREEYERLIEAVRRAIAVAERALAEAERLERRPRYVYAYECRLCGREFEDSALLVAHFERDHADLDIVSNWRLFRLEGRRYPRGEKVRDLLSAGLARRYRRRLDGVTG